MTRQLRRGGALVSLGLLLGTAVACGPDRVGQVDPTTDESAQTGSTTDGLISTSGNRPSTDTRDAGPLSAGTSMFDDDGGSMAAATTGGHDHESADSYGLDPTTSTGSSTTSAGSSTESEDSSTEPEDSSTEPAETGATAGATDSSTESEDSSDATGSTPTCDGVAACNDHGACIETVGGLLCDCEVEGLPVCELPLVREIGSSGTSRELILASISADGSTIVGSHAPRGTPSEQPAVAVKWTLDGGLEALELDPAGDNVALSITADNRIIVGYVQVSHYPEEWVDVVWRDGVLEPRDPDEEFDFGGPRPPVPTAAEMEERLTELGIEHWEIEYVNSISEDGKVMFWLGHGPDSWKRWQLRLP